MAADNVRTGVSYGGASDPCAVVLFGASGDLAKRKVIPAMYDLAVHNSLGERYTIVGFARTAMSDESFRATVGEAAKGISEVGPIDPAKWDAFAANLHYNAGDYSDPQAYTSLAKRPGTEMSIGNVTMNFSYREGFGEATRSAYATLVNDCVRGDATLFDRADSVEAAWSLVDPILDVWSAAKSATVPEYASGSWGPKESDNLLERDGRKWYNP
ncbi:MAG: hypothetical protein NVS9B14_20260 [Candidatus Acidiferrum sp.]